MSLADQVWTHGGLNWYFLPKPNICNLFEFPATKFTQKINVFPHLSSENCEIISLNLTCQGLSNNTKNTPKFLYNFQFWFYLSLSTLTHQELSEDTESMTWSTGSFGRLQCDKIKQGVCHTVALPFTLKNILRQKKNDGNSNISPCKNMIFKKIL